MQLIFGWEKPSYIISRESVVMATTERSSPGITELRDEFDSVRFDTLFCKRLLSHVTCKNFILLTGDTPK